MGRIMDIFQLISTLAGVLGFGIATFVAFFAVRNGVMKDANAAQSSAIDAMQFEIKALRERVDDTEKENIRLEQTMQTICVALEKKGFFITIQGEMVNIEDRRSNKSTTTRIRRTPIDSN
jgi:hypothetical protein